MNQIELKAKMLCEGVNVDKKAGELFQKQNPSNVKRGGLGSGGKIQLENGLFVNVPFYRKRKVDLKIVLDPKGKWEFWSNVKVRLLLELLSCQLQIGTKKLFQ